MAFCSKCGSSLKDGMAFCGSCGTPVGSTAASPAAGSSGGSIQSSAASAPMASNVAALLAYLPFVGWIIAIVFIVVEPYKKDKFVRFHAFQSLFFGIFCFIQYSVLGMLVFSASWSFGFSFFSMIWGLLRLAIFLCWLFLMFKAYNKEKFRLPVIGDFAAQQAG